MKNQPNEPTTEHFFEGQGPESSGSRSPGAEPTRASATCEGDQTPEKVGQPLGDGGAGSAAGFADKSEAAFRPTGGTAAEDAHGLSANRGNSDENQAANAHGTRPSEKPAGGEAAEKTSSQTGAEMLDGIRDKRKAACLRTETGAASNGAADYIAPGSGPSKSPLTELYESAKQETDRRAARMQRGRIAAWSAEKWTVFCGALRRRPRKQDLGRIAAALCAGSVLLMPLLFWTASGLSFVYIREEAGVFTPHLTVLSEPEEIAETCGYPLRSGDRLEEEVFGTTRIFTLHRAYEVVLKADGRTVTVGSTGETAAELFERAGIRIGGDDILSCAPDAVPQEGETVSLQRVVYETRTEYGTLPYESVTEPSPLVREGRTVLVRNGEDGSGWTTWLDRYVDGEYDDSEWIGVEYEEEPLSELTIVGDPDAVVSKVGYLSDVALVDGVPETYERVIESATCTAYYYPRGCYGASGCYLVQGFVAVDPEVIPYGSLLYIASDDFVYGWAVAADCGTAMMYGNVDIDCFFESYTESCLFGKKYLDVYIVRQLTQHELRAYRAHGMFDTRLPE